MPRRRPVAVYRVIDEDELLGEQCTELPEPLALKGNATSSNLEAARNARCDAWPGLLVRRRWRWKRLVCVLLGVGALSLVASAVLLKPPPVSRRPALFSAQAALRTRVVTAPAQDLELADVSHRARRRPPRHPRRRTYMNVAASAPTALTVQASKITVRPNVQTERPGSPAPEFGFER